MRFMGVVTRRTFLSRVGGVRWDGANCLTLPKRGMAFVFAPGLATAPPDGISNKEVPPLRPEQRRAMAAIERQSGRVERAEDLPGAPVVRVMLGHPQDQRRGSRRHCWRFPTVQTLVIARCTVTDDGLENLEGLTDLQALYLSGNVTIDDGLRHLIPLEQLQILDLWALASATPA